MDDNLHSYRESFAIKNFENHFDYGIKSNNHVKSYINLGNAADLCFESFELSFMQLQIERAERIM